jgi:hypothetical protein
MPAACIRYRGTGKNSVSSVHLSSPAVDGQVRPAAPPQESSQGSTVTGQKMNGPLEAQCGPFALGYFESIHHPQANVPWQCGSNGLTESSEEKPNEKKRAHTCSRERKKKQETSFFFKKMA